ncbi:MAG: ribonuclease E/G [Clostridia bacterium]|nr:ribonuclease E/G [Clostridia bacterium]
MKELYCRRTEFKSAEITVTEQGEPCAQFTYSFSELNKFDIIAGKAVKKDDSLGFYFSDIGSDVNAFCDDNMPEKGKAYPLRIVSLPEGSKQYRASPVISFTGLFTFVEFIPDFSKQSVPEVLKVSKKIPAAKAEILKQALSDVCGRMAFDGYKTAVTVRTICGDSRVSNLMITEELETFCERFAKILSSIKGSPAKKPAVPGDILYKTELPEYVTAFLKYNDYSSIVTDDPETALSFRSYFDYLPAPPEVSVDHNIERLFDVKDALRKIPRYLGRYVKTKSGAVITYDKTEAMHVFDVNSAESKLGARDVNLECCEVISRIVSLRNLRGIIMCDFINMRSKDDEDAVLKRMKELALSDFRPFKIYGFTSLKVLECARFK